MVTAPIPLPTSSSQPTPAHTPTGASQGAVLRAAAPEPNSPASSSSDFTEPNESATHPSSSQAREAAAPLRPSPGGAQCPQATPATAGLRSSLFADPMRASTGFAAFAPQAQAGFAPAQPAEIRQSLFRAVTGAFRRTPWGPVPVPDQPTVRAEPGLSDQRPEPLRASVRPAASDDMGLDIPAFLRRQSS